MSDQNEEINSEMEEEIALDPETSKNRSAFYKQLFARYGIFCGILVAMLGILILFTLLSRNSWKKTLAFEVQQVLQENSANNYQVGEKLQLASLFETVCAVFHLSSDNARDTKQFYGVIIRITTIYGPLPAVYVYDSKNKTAHFIDFADMNNIASPRISENSMNSQISRWAKRIPSIVEKNLEGRGNKRK